ncbi:Ig-like domain-containing protein [Aquimarina sp. MMG016]|uniref:Ig-like domain-containing protein n=1 Tax=Aquimarina sp. MMG016 TaxID=2822690 RepID=UPI001B3A731D|nr:Ig-like domain-containing protein [Aquimarina sp. MMG016]MBQ4819516.1 T9SS type A sorting domain-containing protein [Aquimarina sp. MMG016]
MKQKKILLLIMLVFSIGTVLAQWNPRPSWKDSYKANGYCFCDSNFDHGISNKKVTINGNKYSVRDICNELEKHPRYRKFRSSDIPYNDIQCGNGPANDAGDEDPDACPGRVDQGPSGCQTIGPKWDMNWLRSRPRFGGGNSRPSVSFKTPSGNATVQEGYTSFDIEVNASDVDGSISNVKLFVNGNLIRQENIAPYTWGNGSNANELLGLSIGNHSIRAVATDNDGATAEATITLKVEGEVSTMNPVVSFVKPSGDLNVQEGYDMEVEVNATDQDGTINNVRLYINNNLVRQENVFPYTWGHATSPNPEEVNGLSPGTYTIKAVATDNEGNTGEDSYRLIVQNNQPVTTVLTPIHDAYLQGNTRFNNADLRVESGKRISYLMFDLNSIAGTVSSAELRLTVGSDPGNGQINIYLGNGIDWTENNLSNSNKSGRGALLASKNTSFNTNGTYVWDFNDFTAGDKVSLIVEHTSGNDVSFWSKEGNKKPQLVVTTNGSRRVEVLSSKETDKIKISMHPNPSKDVVFLRDFPSSTYQVNVYDFQGKEISTKKINKDQSQIRLDVQDLESGLYFVKVFSSNKKALKTRFLKL